MTPVLEQVVGAPRVSGLGFGSRMRDTEEGQVKIAAAILRYIAHCEQTETPWFPCPKSSDALDLEESEPVGSAS